MSATLIRFPSVGAPVAPTHRAPVISLPLGRRLSFFLPIASACSGAVCSAALAAFVGWHIWLVIPVVIAAGYGWFLRRAFG